MFRVLGAILDSNGGPLSDEDFAEAMRALEPDWNGWLGDDGAPPRVPVFGVWWGKSDGEDFRRGLFRGFAFKPDGSLYPSTFGPQVGLHCDSCVRGFVAAALEKGRGRG